MPAAPKPIPPIPPFPVTTGVSRRAPRHTRSVSLSASLAIHAVLLALTGLIVWRVAEPSLSGPQTTITFESPSLGDDQPVPRPAAERRDSQPPSEIRIEESMTHPPTPAALSPAPPPLQGLSSLTAPGSSPSELRGLSAVGVEPGSEAPKFTADPAATARPIAFAGLGASNARSVIYVVDCSGSMVTNFRDVIAEVERSVAGLSPTQKFGVVLCRKPLSGAATSGESGVEVFASVLVRATPSARERLHAWLASAQTSGRSAPMPGLERAVTFKPDAIFLLSRSIERDSGNAWDTSLSEALARVDALNPIDPASGLRPILIQTLQFRDDDPTGIMQEIGRAHGTAKDSAGRTRAGYRLIKRGEDLGGDK